MVRIRSGAAPRLRLVSVRTNRGRRVRALVAFLLSFLLVASGFYGTKSLAQSGEPWDGNPANGDVEVEGSVSSLNLRAGESKSYRIRLSRQPTSDNWWVRIFVNGASRADGHYPPGNREDAMISWMPSVGWEFDVDNNDPEQPTRWRTITFTAHKNIDTPIKIMHEVWEDNTNCPIHERGKITVNAPITGTRQQQQSRQQQSRQHQSRQQQRRQQQWRQQQSAATATAETAMLRATPNDSNPDDSNWRNQQRRRDRNVPKTPAQPEPPAPTGATVDGNKLVLTYNEPLDRNSAPAAGDYTVSGHDVESLSVSGSRVTMILETPAMPSEEVTLSYTPGKKPIKNRTGVEAESFTNMPVENIGKAPVLVDTSVNGNQLILTYDEPLDETSIPATGSYAVTVDGANRDVSKVEINGRKVTLTLKSVVTPGDEITLNYTPGNPRIIDLTEIPAGPITAFGVSNPILSLGGKSEGTNDWLTRFGRTVASQAVENIENRLKSPSMHHASKVTLAGQGVDFFDDDSPLPLTQDDPQLASATRLASRTLGPASLRERVPRPGTAIFP